MKLASFDIFDTTLIRKCGKPENIFYLLAHKLYPNNEAKRNDFIAWRKRAPISMSRILKKIELNIEDIYSSTDCLSFVEYTRQELINSELETEADNLIANKTIADLINCKRKEGYHIAFISDMYINSDFLAKILKRENCFIDGDSIFVSCEEQARKDHGEMYNIVRKRLSPKIWEHYGDNKFSDIKIAKRKGIKAKHINTRNNALEERIENIARELPSLGELSLLAGLTRCARVINNNPYSSIAANYVAAAYIPFVKWIIETAIKENIRTLYFLSRDSYILYKIAESIPHEGIELKYLFLSRRSLMRPYLHKNTPEAYLKVADGQTLIGRDPKHMLWQLLLTKEGMKEQFGIEYNYNRISNKEEENDFIEKLFNSNFTKTFQEECSIEEENLINYLVQEGLTDNKRLALIDVGWLGSSRVMLNTILERNGHTPVEFIYYGTRKDIYNSKYGKYYSYFPAGTLNTNMTQVIENYYSASPYPTTIGYKKDKNGEYAPVFPERGIIKHSRIVEENIHVSTWMAKQIEAFRINNKTILALWSSMTLNSLSQMEDDIDVTPFTKSEDFDNDAFAKKISAKELFLFIFTGKRITQFDLASLKYTCGFRTSRTLMKIHKFTRKIRGYLYNKILLKR